MNRLCRRGEREPHRDLELLFAANPDVFVAGDLLWYPVEGENNIPPQVVFEILSPGNRLKAMAQKYKFYERYGTEEYYIYDPDNPELIGWLRSREDFEVIEEMNGWVSPRLGIRFQLTSDNLEIFAPSGERFLSFVQLAQLTEQERQRAEHERQRVDEALTQLEQERQRYQALEALLRERGIDPNQL